MNAIDYFKEYGLKGSRDHLDWMVRVGARSDIHGDFMEDLKRIIESHELVSNFGGIKRAKRILKKSYTSFNKMVSVVWNDKPFQCTIEKLEKAILDVESCQ